MGSDKLRSTLGNVPPTPEVLRVSPYLGTMVSVAIDRPLGSTHPRVDLVYPVNYGFLPETQSGDGDELDAYVLGVDKPCTTFSGRCIAVILRDEEDDPKLVVVPDGTELSDADIFDATHFQEQFFHARILRLHGRA